MPKIQKITSDNRAQMMLEAPLNQIIPRLAIPTIISMLITAVYNMADTYFVSQISTEASAAVGVIFSAMAIFQAIAFMIGMGSGTNLSRALGRGDTEATKTYVSCGFFIALILGLLILIAGRLNIHPIVRFLGATDEIEPDAIAYATYIFYAAPFMMCSFAMNNLLRFQGMAMYSMVGISLGGILNVFLDPLLIFGFGLGTAGAAIATALSQFVSFLILLFMCNTRKNTISISVSAFKPTPRVVGNILYNGFPSLGRQGIASVATILINRVAGTISNDPAVISATIASISIVNRFVMFINSAVIGFGQGFQPVCGFCYGAGRYDRVREAYRFCVKVATVILLVLAAIAMIFSSSIIRFFRADDPIVVEIGTFTLRLQLLSLPLWGLYVMSNMCTQSIGYGFTSTLVSSARQGIFLIPTVLILPRLFGLFGLQIAQPVSDVLAFLFALFIMRRVMRDLKEKEMRRNEPKTE
ncbi:MAG: MATE family efflux transporter [Clostridia bacterium]|nr:MATE family efflux transporter [Clostridia bacterium]